MAFVSDCQRSIESSQYAMRDGVTHAFCVASHWGFTQWSTPTLNPVKTTTAATSHSINLSGGCSCKRVLPVQRHYEIQERSVGNAANDEWFAGACKSERHGIGLDGAEAVGDITDMEIDVEVFAGEGRGD